jgi:hypothetical protein
LLDQKAITPTNAVVSHGESILKKIVGELDERAILTLLERSGEAAAAQEIREALEEEVGSRLGSH